MKRSKSLGEVPLKTLLNNARTGEVTSPKYFSYIFQTFYNMRLSNIIDRRRDEMCEYMQNILTNCGQKEVFYDVGLYSDLVQSIGKLYNKNKIGTEDYANGTLALENLCELFLDINRKKWSAQLGGFKL